MGRVVSPRGFPRNRSNASLIAKDYSGRYRAYICFLMPLSLSGVYTVYYKIHFKFPVITLQVDDYIGPNICHHEIGPMVTQDFTVAKLAILA